MIKQNYITFLENKSKIFKNSTKTNIYAGGPAIRFQKSWKN